MSPNRLLRSLFTLLLLASASAAPLGAQPELDERISLELEDADVGQVLESLGSILEREVEVDPAIGGTISIELHDVRVETALTAVCESAGCVWNLDARRLRMSPDPSHPPAKPRPRPTRTGLDEPIDMELKDASLGETLRAFGSIAELPVILDDGVDQDAKVTVQLASTPAGQALDVICRMNGCAWEVVEHDDGTAVLHVRAAE